MHVLFSRRKRIDKLALDESAGLLEWTTDFSPRARNRILLHYRDVSGEYFVHGLAQARELIMLDEGLLDLTGRRFNAHEDMAQFIQDCESNAMPMAIEALITSLQDRGGWPAPQYGSQFKFCDMVRLILREESLAFDLVDLNLVEFSSRQLTQSVVLPVLSLLGRQQGWSDVEGAYQDALREISHGTPADSITDSGRALELTLERLGCRGSSLGERLKAARASGLLLGSDDKLAVSITHAVGWAAVERNERSDAHRGSEADVADAWMMVHIVGAVILRLVQGPRGAAS